MVTSGSARRRRPSHGRHEACAPLQDPVSSRRQLVLAVLLRSTSSFIRPCPRYIRASTALARPNLPSACSALADRRRSDGLRGGGVEFFAQAFTVYEEAVSDSKAQFQAVCVIASARQTRNFGKESYDIDLRSAPSTPASSYASRTSAVLPTWLVTCGGRLQSLPTRRAEDTDVSHIFFPPLDYRDFTLSGKLNEFA